MVLSLIRHHDHSRAATLDPRSGELRVVERSRNPQGGPPYWLPDLRCHGAFDHLGGLLVALYRDPEDPAALRLQLGASRHPLGATSRSVFSPDFEDDEPRLEGSDVLRTFELFEGADLVAKHSYRLHDYERRLERGKDPFPAWPDEEANYDLLLRVHQILEAGTWRQVFPVVPGEKGAA